jgi:hypothetical protein
MKHATESALDAVRQLWDEVGGDHDTIFNAIGLLIGAYIEKCHSEDAKRTASVLMHSIVDGHVAKQMNKLH